MFQMKLLKISYKNNEFHLFVSYQRYVEDQEFSENHPRFLLFYKLPKSYLELFSKFSQTLLFL